MSVSGLGFLKRLGARKTGERKTGAPQASQQAHPRIVPLSKQSRPFLATKVSAGPDLPSLTDRPTDLTYYSTTLSQPHLVESAPSHSGTRILQRPARLV
jgi:hypothetical protein